MSPLSKDFPYPVTKQEENDAKEFLRSHNVSIFIVAYHAEEHIESLLNRIPSDLIPLLAEIFIIDDSSTDETFQVSKKAKAKFKLPHLNIYQTPYNRGYGGNQKLGYLYSIAKNHDVVILLHGDGQYPPEYLPRIIAQFQDEKIDAVFASRMMTKKYALKGGMPLYKWIGNQILTNIENSFLGTHLSEFHTGYRAYRTSMLRKIPFKYNDDGFHFDTEIIIQIAAAKGKIKEVPVPTHYGQEICRVNGFAYAYNCIRSVIWYRLTQYGIFFDRRFDVNLFENRDYSYKKSPNTVYQYVLSRKWRKGSKVIDLCPGSGRLPAEIAEKGPEVYAVSENALSLSEKVHVLSLDLKEPFDEIVGKHQFDVAIMLDGLEHHNTIGDISERISNILKSGGVFYACTGNVVYFPVRIIFLLGAFHYGKRGILDRTHTRLFTKRALVRLMKNSGFRVKKIRGFGPPLRDMVSDSLFMRILDCFLSALARLSPSLFGYQILAELQKMDDVESILEKTLNKSDRNQHAETPETVQSPLVE
jgi:glycosyltransferase involved in cell wall biosynthesis